MLALAQAEFNEAVPQALRDLHAPAVAVDHFTRGLEAAHHLGPAPPSDMLREQAHGYEALSHTDAAAEDLALALEPLLRVASLDGIGNSYGRSAGRAQSSP